MSEQRLIVVVGDVMLDKYTRVKTRGVSKENAAVLVAREEAVDYSLGGAANVARCVRALSGGSPLLIGFNSDNRVIHLLDRTRITYTFDRPAHGQTPVKNRIVTQDGHYLLRLDEESTFFGRPEEWWKAGGHHLGAAFKRALFDGRDTPKPVVCLVDYDKGCLTRAAARCLLYHVNSVTEHVTFPVIVDPGRCGAWEKYGSPRTVFRANLHQAMQHYARVGHVVGTRLPFDAGFDPLDTHPQQVYETAAHAVCANLEAAGTEYAYVLLTLGPGGLVLADRRAKKLYYKAAPKVPVADTCGAGDAVTAAMAVVLADQEFPLSWDSMTAAVTAGGNAAAIAVRKPGVYAVTREDMGWFTKTEPTPLPT